MESIVPLFLYEIAPTALHPAVAHFDRFDQFTNVGKQVIALNLQTTQNPTTMVGGSLVLGELVWYIFALKLAYPGYKLLCN